MNYFIFVLGAAIGAIVTIGVFAWFNHVEKRKEMFVVNRENVIDMISLKKAINTRGANK